MTRDERLDRVERRQADLAKAMTQVLSQLGEQSLKLRFILTFFKFERAIPNAIIVPGEPAPTEMATLHEIYRAEGRDQILAAVDAEVAALHEQLAAATRGTHEEIHRAAESAREGGGAAGEPAAGGNPEGAPGLADDGPTRVSNFAKATAH